MPTLDRVIPLLVYRDIQAAHDFLVQAFGFESGGVECDADGKPVHGEVRVGGTDIWLHRVTEEHELSSPQSVDMAGRHRADDSIARFDLERATQRLRLTQEFGARLLP